jgi:hypothetical protein
MKQLLELLIPVIIILLSLAAWSLFFFIRSPARPTTKAAAIPIVIAGVFVIAMMMTLWLGKSVPLPLPEEMNVLAHHTIVKNGKKSDIEIWTKEGSGTRLYTTPYFKPLEDALKEAEKGREQGLQSKLKRRGKGKGDGKGNQGTNKPQTGPLSPYEVELLAPNDINPKDGTAPAPAAPEQPAPEYHKPDPKFMT